MTRALQDHHMLQDKMRKLQFSCQALSDGAGDQRLVSRQRGKKAHQIAPSSYHGLHSSSESYNEYLWTCSLFNLSLSESEEWNTDGN